VVKENSKDPYGAPPKKPLIEKRGKTDPGVIKREWTQEKGVRKKNWSQKPPSPTSEEKIYPG